MKNGFWRSLIEAVLIFFNKERILKFLKEKATKKIIIKLFGTAAMGGIKGWLISFVVNELIEEVEEHVVDPLIRKTYLIVDSVEGKTVYKRVKHAKSNSEWRDRIKSV